MKALPSLADSHAINMRTVSAVRAELARIRLTQSELARQLGYTKPRLWRRMTGRIPFTVSELKAIAAVIGCPPERLINP